MLKASDRFLNIQTTLCALVLLALVLFSQTAPRTLAQGNDSYEAQRERALKLYDENKFTEAAPLLEKLSTQNSNDVLVFSRLGYALFASSASIKDPELRKQVRARARTALLRANELGDRSDLTRLAIEELIANESGEVSFSNLREADEAMKEGEAAFVRGDFPKALAAYERALKADPKLYDAALFMGDVYFKSKRPEQAGVWFARAISINPDRETAYRYWGDSLLLEGKTNEARDKFVEAYIAEPYNRLSTAGLVNLAQRTNLRLAHPKIEIPTSVTTPSQGNTTITLDQRTIAARDGSSAWMLYGISRATWPTSEFAKRFPNERVYRHSLPEEAEALRRVAEQAASDLKDKKVTSLEPSLAKLVKLNAAGLLEAYVLLARADQGIARDYAAYRKANADKLRRYVIEYILTGGGE
ncbi:MAG TPA: tetratricopeptide repeat protein [Pyrinomonadaceae bacterium]|jgi:tetratricopeptide (TPR) repeat protein